MAYSINSKDYFNTVLWTTDGTGNKALTTGHSTDMVWIKFRDYAYDNRIYDDVRGVTKKIIPNKTDAESTTTDLASFDTNGFTVGSNLNSSGEGGLVGWSWKANGQGSSNTDGSINTTYTSANTTSGTSIVKWTGTGSNATIGHGLGVAPSMIITKSLVATQEWCVGMDALGWDKYLFLNETSGSQSGSTYWQSTAPTSTVFSVGTAGPTNSSSAMIAYCFAEKTGFSKFGSYSGNGNGNGAFVYTGFKPKFLIIKNYSGNGDNWIMLTNELSTSGSNVINNYLKADTNASESTASSNFPVDFFSTGFKLRGTDSGYNNASSTYVYMAWADAPLVGTNNIPATAR